MQNMYSQEAQSIWSGLLSSKYLAHQLSTTVLDLIFPPRCTGCGRVDYRWCNSCRAELEASPLSPSVRPLSETLSVASTGLHGGKVQQAIHALKYDNVPEVGAALATRMVEVLKLQSWQIDTIVPVPLHTSRKLQRGYNQSQILGEFISQSYNIPCDPDVVIRQRETQSQVTLNRQERLTNMQDAFLANSELISGKTLLIVDDVLTTGATLLAVSEALLEAGATRTYGLTITTAS